nr:hypothetical protein [Tanacetum cinerariifolium]
TVMSDSKDSIITYTVVSSPFGGLSDIGSPGVDGPPVMPEDPYAYVGDEEENEYLALADSIVVALPAVDHAPSAEETELFETDESAATPPPHPAYCVVDTVERGELSTPAAMEVGYGITDAWDDLAGAIQEIAPTTVEGVNQRVTELSTTFDRETSMIYAMIEEKRDDQALQKAQVNRLFRDRRYHARTASLMKDEARASHTAWAQSMDASDVARSGLIALRTQVSAHRTVITDLRASHRRFQTTVRTQQEDIRELRAADHKLHAQFIHAQTTLKSCQT